MFFVKKNFLMRIGYDVDINSSHVDREDTSQDVSAKEHLVLTISPNIWEAKQPNMRHETPSTTTLRENLP